MERWERNTVERDQEQQGAEESRSESWGDRLSSIREKVTEPIDRISGADFRREFEKFTEVVATTVVGVHQDQAQSTERLARLEESVARIQQDQTVLAERLTRLEESQSARAPEPERYARRCSRGAGIDSERCRAGGVLMEYSSLLTLAEAYPRRSRDELLDLAQERSARQESEILVLAALAADVGADDIVNLGARTRRLTRTRSIPASISKRGHRSAQRGICGVTTRLC